MNPTPTLTRARRARAIIVNDFDEVALLERHVRDRHYWSLPGGGIEPGETPVQTAVREVLEELGVRLDPDRLAFVGVGGPHALYLARVPGRPSLVLGGPELARSNPENRYDPRWLPLGDALEARLRCAPVRDLFRATLTALRDGGLDSPAVA